MLSIMIELFLFESTGHQRFQLKSRSCTLQNHLCYSIGKGVFLVVCFLCNTYTWSLNFTLKIDFFLYQAIYIFEAALRTHTHSHTSTHTHKEKLINVKSSLHTKDIKVGRIPLKNCSNTSENIKINKL